MYILIWHQEFWLEWIDANSPELVTAFASVCHMDTFQLNHSNASRVALFRDNQHGIIHDDEANNVRITRWLNYSSRCCYDCLEQYYAPHQ